MDEGEFAPPPEVCNFFFLVESPGIFVFINFFSMTCKQNSVKKCFNQEKPHTTVFRWCFDVCFAFFLNVSFALKHFQKVDLKLVEFYSLFLSCTTLKSKFLSPRMRLWQTFFFFFLRLVRKFTWTRHSSKGDGLVGRVKVRKHTW